MKERTKTEVRGPWSLKFCLIIAAGIAIGTIKQRVYHVHRNFQNSMHLIGLMLFILQR